MKNVFDFFIGALALLAVSPILLIFSLLIFLQDRHHPFYLAPRVGKNEKPFTMIKLRSMIMNADKSGVDSTANDDVRITKLGKIIRKYKLDELAQLINVVKGDMSLVGPRPNVKRETDLYTQEEKRLLSVRPGITDISSIVFSDEGDILEGKSDPDLAYNQLIRPGKGYLGLFYVDNMSIPLDIKLIFLTVVAVLSKKVATSGIVSILKKHNAEDFLIKIAKREDELVPMPPPGATHIVEDRDSIPT